MKIFISWSGARSKTAALALKSLLEDIYPEAVDVFISDHISPGENWSHRIGTELEKSQFGVLCLTRDNFQAPWLLFEAGAIARKFEASRLVPYLIDQLPEAVADRSPLSLFQSVPADREGTYRLVHVINAAREIPQTEQRLERAFRRWWPDLEETLAGLPSSLAGQSAQRSDRELLEIILQRIDLLTQASKESRTPNLPRAELIHLFNLRYQPTMNYAKRDELKRELRHLRDLALIKNKQLIASLPETFQLDEHFELTDSGRDYLASVWALPGL